MGRDVQRERMKRMSAIDKEAIMYATTHARGYADILIGLRLIVNVPSA